MDKKIGCALTHPILDILKKEEFTYSHSIVALGFGDMS